MENQELENQKQEAPAVPTRKKQVDIEPLDMNIQLLNLSPSTEVGIIAFFVSLPFLGIGSAILGLGETGFFLVAVGATSIGIGTKIILTKPAVKTKLGLDRLNNINWKALFGTLDDLHNIVDGSVSTPEQNISGQEQETTEVEQEQEGPETDEIKIFKRPPLPSRDTIVPPGREKGKGLFPTYPEDQTLHLGTVIATGQRFDPPINAILGMGVIVAGAPGAGKSNLAAVIGEQAGNCRMSEVFFDLKREYHTLVQTVPNGIRAGHPDYAAKAGSNYYPLTVENTADFAADIMEHGFQAIIDIPSYKGDYDLVAKIMAGVLNGLMDWAEEQPPNERHNCLIGIDEAHNYFPEKPTTSAMKIAPVNLDTLQRAFSRITNLGRSYGYTPVLFTQRIPNIAKSVIANCQVKVIKKHSLDIDVRRCEEEAGTETVNKQTIKRLRQGSGIIVGLTEEPVIVQFDTRQSEHVSHTPDISRSHQRFKKGYQRLSRVLATRIPGTTRYQPVETPPATPETTSEEVDPRQLRLVHSAPAERVPRKYERPLQAWNNGNTSVRSLATAISVTDSVAYRIMREMDNAGLIRMKKRAR